MSLPFIDLSIAERLKRDPEFRRHFFLAETSAHIARQLIALRKMRKLNQAQLAEKLGTKQPAISRVESADYRHWSYDGLRKHAEALDGCIRVFIDPVEKAILEYERLENESAEGASDPSAIAQAGTVSTLIQSENAIADADSARLNAVSTTITSDEMQDLTTKGNTTALQRGLFNDGIPGKTLVIQ